MAIASLVSECSNAVPGLCPASRSEVPWLDWARLHIAWPLGVQAVRAAVFLVLLRPGYQLVYRSSSLFRHTIKSYVGTPDRQARSPHLLMTTITADILCSVIGIVTWLRQTYQRDTTLFSRALLLVCALVHVITAALGHLREECTVASACRVTSLVDVFTVMPTLVLFWHQDGDSQVEWLSLHWLRAASVIECFQQLRGLCAAAQYSGVVVQMVVVMILRCTCLIVIMAGTIFTSEVLGDIPFFDGMFADKFVIAPSGDRLSPLQMCYWVVVSITTVGYGDFAPRTLVARVLTCFFIVFGIAYLFLVQVDFSRAWAEIREGSGVYLPRNNSRNHVVVVLSTRRRAVQFSSMLAGFLREILHTERQEEWPDVVIFSRTPWDESDSQDSRHTSTFDDFLRTEGLYASVRRRVSFIVGRFSSKVDLDRAAIGSSHLIFLLADLTSDAPDKEDEDNLLTAVLMRKFFPQARLRMMLLKPQSKELAVQAGIEISRCFSLQELKANILAQNVRCHGIVPMITGMLHSVDVREENLQASLVQASGRGKASARSANSVSAGSRQQSPHLSPNPKSRSGSDMTRDPGAHPIPVLGQDGRSSRASSASSSSMPDDTVPDARESEMKSRKSDASNVSMSSHRSFYRRRRYSSQWREKVKPWILDYMEGLQRSVWGFELSEEYAGLSFGELVARIFQRTGAIVFAMFLRSQLVICPQDMEEVEPFSICFAVAKDASVLAEVRWSKYDANHWRIGLLKARHVRQRRARMEGPHVSAAKLMGHSMRRALLVHKAHPAESNRVGSIDFMDLPRFGRSPSCHIMTPNQRLSMRMLQHRASVTSGISVLTDSMEANLRFQKMQLRELRRNVDSSQEELVVLIVCQGEVWSQVLTFVTSLHAQYLPATRPVVVFAPTPPPKGLFDDDFGAQVICVEGNCLKSKSLLEAGVLEAGAIVVMSGEASVTEDRETWYQDTRSVLCAQVLECWCGMSEREVLATYELQHSGSVKKLPSLMNKPVVDLEELLSSPSRYLHRMSHEVITKSEPDGRGSLASSLSSATDGAGTLRLSKAGEEDDDRPPSRASAENSAVMYHPRFAAGQIFTPELWGAMLGCMFYMPAIIELVEALAMPHKRGQQAYPWQIRVPAPYVGNMFGELLSDLAVGLFLSRIEADHPTKDDSPAPLGPAVAMALYRRREDTVGLASGTGGHNYTILAPPHTTRLRADDWVVVLGSARFGRCMHDMQLLRGSKMGSDDPPQEPSYPSDRSAAEEMSI